MVLFVILKCYSNFPTFNWHLQVLIMQKEIQYQCPHSKLFPGFRACFYPCSFVKDYFEEKSCKNIQYEATAGGPAYYVLHLQKGITICLFF